MTSPRKIPQGTSRAEYRHSLKHCPGGIRNKQKTGNPTRHFWKDPIDPKAPGRWVVLGGSHDGSIQQRAKYERDMEAFKAKYPNA